MADLITIDRAVVQQVLEALEASRRSHYYCEDTWYSCPKHEDGCSNEMEGDECNCGADEANEKIDQSITALRAALAQAEPVQEPVAWMRPDNRVAEESYSRTQFSRGRDKPPIGTWTPLYTAPQQQAEPVQFDLAEAMNLADNYASAQSEMDSEHSVNRQYYVQSRNEERAKLAVYLGIKEAK